MKTQNWFLIKTPNEYNTAIAKYHELKHFPEDSEEYKEKILLTLLISEFERTAINFDKKDPIQLILIRMDDLNLNVSDLVKVYSNKITISKVLNYKQALSITMIRKFSKFLQIDANLLIREYKLINK